MHRCLRSIGFGAYQKRREIERLLADLERQAELRTLTMEKEWLLCEARAEVAPGMGVVMMGELKKDGSFHREYYYPYLSSKDISSRADCSIQRQTEKESFAGLLDENRVGISLIFYLENAFDYRKLLQSRASRDVRGVALTGLSTEGKILMPLQKTPKQIEHARVAARERNSRVEAAKNGDEDAMESLTIEDIDLYSQISRRVLKEDVYSIVDSSFMPSGIECDQYSIIAEILNVEEKENRITGEKVYDLKVDCNDMVFHVGIAAADLLGEPLAGRRFKGQIWMQGVAEFAGLDQGAGFQG